MRCTIVLEFDNGDGSVVKRVEVMRLHRPIDDQTHGDVGLSLSEGKCLLNCMQQEFVVEQIERFCASRRSCVDCGVQRRLHDNHCLELKTALGKVYYCRERWKACNCGADDLFMHYAFGSWMEREHPRSSFARYADDAVVHCRTRAQAEAVRQAIASLMEACGLMMHPEKSKVVYCRDSNRTEEYPNVRFTFLGFTFRPRAAMNKHGRRFTNFLPGVSNDALTRMRQKVRSWRLHRRTSVKLNDLAEQ